MPADGQGRGLVLVVDDEDPVRRLATSLLTTLGFEVVAATDVAAAVDAVALHGDELALVLLDLTMPGVDGVDLLATLERQESRIPVVVSSGYDAADLANRFAGRDVAGFLQKPYRLEEMRAILHRALAGR